MDKIKPVAGCVVGDWGLVDPFMAREVNDELLWDEPYIVKLYDQSAIDALRAEVERLQADAARYQWLVDSGKFCPSLNIGWALRIGASDKSAKQELDAAIDAAMQEGAQ